MVALSAGTTKGWNAFAARAPGRQQPALSIAAVSAQRRGPRALRRGHDPERPGAALPGCLARRRTRSEQPDRGYRALGAERRVASGPGRLHRAGFSQADFSRVMARGGSCGGNIALLLAVRDARITIASPASAP